MNFRTISLSPLYVCTVNIKLKYNFALQTPREFIIVVFPQNYILISVPLSYYIDIDPSFQCTGILRCSLEKETRKQQNFGTLLELDLSLTQKG